ncbi:uncharacterized protein LOC106011880 [Aplysia californica]|uniref:Uncharacterized protein LOC106011880 n=1 Tax=Aplysia californica TaxID=6500 RepID=A0ABM1A0Q8_APLCA|nr:uncharacterized protein LOC106011880 [Aplysia californica]
MVGLSLLGGKKQGSRPTVIPPETKVYKEEVIEPKSSTGPDFAKATMDYQPQHLNTLTAKLVGFDKPIAHGLWSMAVAVDRIMKNEKCYKNTYPFHVNVTFRRPFPLGSQGLLRYDEPAGEKNYSKFKIIKADNRQGTILEGEIYTGEKMK